MEATLIHNIEKEIDELSERLKKRGKKPIAIVFSDEGGGKVSYEVEGLFYDSPDSIMLDICLGLVGVMNHFDLSQEEKVSVFKDVVELWGGDELKQMKIEC